MPDASLEPLDCGPPCLPLWLCVMASRLHRPAAHGPPAWQPLGVAGWPQRLAPALHFVAHPSDVDLLSRGRLSSRQFFPQPAVLAICLSCGAARPYQTRALARRTSTRVPSFKLTFGPARAAYTHTDTYTHTRARARARTYTHNHTQRARRSEHARVWHPALARGRSSDPLGLPNNRHGRSPPRRRVRASSRLSVGCHRCGLCYICRVRGCFGVGVIAHSLRRRRCRETHLGTPRTSALPQAAREPAQLRVTYRYPMPPPLMRAEFNDN